MPVELYLLTGFLGAGKTTLLNHLLAQPAWASRRLALLINEFGELGIDGKLVDNDTFRRYEVNGGSVFCACTQAEVLAALADVAHRRKADAVLIETTGIAEPGSLEQALASPRLFGQFAVRANVCLIDAAHFTKVVAFARAAREQVEQADVLVINKTDLAPSDELEQLGLLLAELNPTAPRMVTRRGRVSAEFLNGVAHRAPQRAIERAPVDIVAVTIRRDTPLSRPRFHQAITELGPRLLRLKGNVDLGQGPRFVEVAGRQFREGPPLAELSPSTAFTVIAWNTDRAALARAFEEETLS